MDNRCNLRILINYSQVSQVGVVSEDSRWKCSYLVAIQLPTRSIYCFLSILGYYDPDFQVEIIFKMIF